MNVKVWSTTDSSNLAHAFTEDGQGPALCNRRIKARMYDRTHNDFRTRDFFDNDVHRICPRCDKKFASLVEQAAPAEQGQERAAEQADEIRVATRGYRRAGGCVTETRTTIHTNCTCRIASTLVASVTTMPDAERIAAEQVQGTGRAYSHCMWSQPLKAASTGPAVHHFSDTGEAYDDTQTREDINDGDVLVIESEQVVGFLVSAWPVSITAERGELHASNPTDARTIDDGKYTASVDAAEQIAREHGFALAASPHKIQAARERTHRAAERVRTNPDADDPEWRAALDELTVALDDQRTIDPIAREALASEALDAVDEVTAAEADDGTWRGQWIGERPTEEGTLFPLGPDHEQGALFGEPAAQPAALGYGYTDNGPGPVWPCDSLDAAIEATANRPHLRVIVRTADGWHTATSTLLAELGAEPPF